MGKKRSRKPRVRCGHCGALLAVKCPNCQAPMKLKTTTPGEEKTTPYYYCTDPGCDASTKTEEKH